MPIYLQLAKRLSVQFPCLLFYKYIFLVKTTHNSTFSLKGSCSENFIVYCIERYLSLVEKSLSSFFFERESCFSSSTVKNKERENSSFMKWSDFSEN